MLRKFVSPTKTIFRKELLQKDAATYDGLANILIIAIFSILLFEVNDGSCGQRNARLATKAHHNIWLQITAED